jgi:hypothetical protein
MNLLLNFCLAIRFCSATFAAYGKRRRHESTSALRRDFSDLARHPFAGACADQGPFRGTLVSFRFSGYFHDAPRIRIFRRDSGGVDEPARARRARTCSSVALHRFRSSGAGQLLADAENPVRSVQSFCGPAATPLHATVLCRDRGAVFLFRARDLAPAHAPAITGESALCLRPARRRGRLRGNRCSYAALRWFGVGCGRCRFRLRRRCGLRVATSAPTGGR